MKKIKILLIIVISFFISVTNCFAQEIDVNKKDLTDDPDIIGPLLFLRQREIIHFTRFKELYDEYRKKYQNK